jgi:aspartyl-tRNA(Asn)/glutamyl-tRNA(Gln) amidotransferase subunit C
MSFSKEALDKLARLARLGFEHTRDGQAIQDDLSKIVAMVEKISDIDTKNVIPMAHPLAMEQPMREDLVTEPNQREELLSLAPKTEAGLFLVPPVIE